MKAPFEIQGGAVGSHRLARSVKAITFLPSSWLLERCPVCSDCKLVRVLIVDDDAEVCQTLQEVLGQHGHITSAIVGARFRSAMVQDYELLVTDLYMPGREGLEIIRELHEIDPNLRILAISGGVSKHTMLKAAEALGASKSLAKPFTAAEFLGAINELAGVPSHASETSRVCPGAQRRKRTGRRHGRRRRVAHGPAE